MASSSVQSAPCLNLMETAEPVRFEELVQRLPKVEPKSEYELQSEYEKRLNAASDGFASQPLLIRGEWDIGPYFDAETSKLIVHGSALGHGRISFASVLGARSDGLKNDYRSGAIAFQLAVTSEEKSTYSAQNGFGASFEIERTERHINALFERPGDSRKSVFMGGRKFKPLAEVEMSGERARDIVENGSFAIAFIPKAPFQSRGVSRVAPSARFRRDVVRNVSVIHADIRCAYVLNGSGATVASFEVK